MINVQYQAPTEQLQRLVSSLYRFDYSGHALHEVERADRAQFRIMLSGAGSYRFADGVEYPTYPVTVIGPTPRPFEAVASEPGSIFGWGMVPAGWAALMGAEAENWVDKAFDGRRVFVDTNMGSDDFCNLLIIPSQHDDMSNSQLLQGLDKPVGVRTRCVS